LRGAYTGHVQSGEVLEELHPGFVRLSICSTSRSNAAFTFISSTSLCVGAAHPRTLPLGRPARPLLFYAKIPVVSMRRGGGS
jgi:hypothetical protein